MNYGEMEYPLNLYNQKECTLFKHALWFLISYPVALDGPDYFLRRSP